MANIGYINKTDEGGLVGKIDTLAFSATIGLRRFMSDNPKAPKYDVMALTPTRTWVKIGALFEQSIRSSGESFYQGRIDDPRLGRTMDRAFFAKEDGGDRKSVVAGPCVSGGVDTGGRRNIKRKTN